jgi:hypothetical protein
VLEAVRGGRAKLTLRTNGDDWRELSTEGLGGIGHAGHDIPEFVWLDLLRAAGVKVEVVHDTFGVEEAVNSMDDEGIG